MSPEQLKALESRDPEKFRETVYGMARQRVASMAIEGIHVSVEGMACLIVEVVRELDADKTIPRALYDGS